MITFGSVYIIAKNFESAVNFYKELLQRDVVHQNKSRYASFEIDGLWLAILNGRYDGQHPDEVTKKENYCSLYDDMKRIMDNANCGKVVINICTDDLKKEYERIRASELGSDLTEIRYVNAGNPYWYFLLKDLDGNTIEITGNYKESGDA